MLRYFINQDSLSPPVTVHMHMNKDIPHKTWFGAICNIILKLFMVLLIYTKGKKLITNYKPSILSVIKQIDPVGDDIAH